MDRINSHPADPAQRKPMLGHSALHRHVLSKQDLLPDTLRQYIADLATHALRTFKRETDPILRLRILNDYLVAKVHSHRAEIMVCLREAHALGDERRSAIAASHARYEGVWKLVWIDGERQGVFRPFDPIVLKGLLCMYFHGPVWLQPPEAGDAKRIADRFQETTLKMLVA